MKKILIMLLLVCSFFALGYNTTLVKAAEDGMSFTAEKKYIVDKKYTEMPKTFRFEILVPKSQNARAGFLLGNYGDFSGQQNSFDIEIAANGKPRLYFSNIAGDKAIDFTFNVDVRTDDWLELALVFDDANKQILCYVDGELKATDTAHYNVVTPDILNEYFVIGGDHRIGNTYYFKGKMKSVSLYNDVKSADELKEEVNLNDSDLFAHYEMNSETGDVIKDLTGNNYDAKYSPEWFSTKEPVKDYAYSFVVVGDTQYLGWSSSKNNTINGVATPNVPTPERVDTLYQWIADNVTGKKIEYVIGLGDITDDDTDIEWSNAANSISKLDGLVPYSLVRGNHDTSEQFYKTFGNATYMDQMDGFYKPNNINSSYDARRIGQTDYLFLTLDYGADDAELAWAASIIEAHPTHRVIISTHCYLNGDGRTLGSLQDINGYEPKDSSDIDFNIDRDYNHGEEMWDKLISRYGNIELVLSGHVSASNVVTNQRKGIHGNVVTEMLIDTQNMDRDIEGAIGMVCMFYFNEDGSQFEVEYYSTIKQQYYRTQNQFVTDLSEAGDNAHNDTHYYNDTHHFSVCDDCGRRTEEVEHVFDGACDTQCNDCEYTRETVNHSFTLDKYDEYTHYKECDVCHAVDSSSVEQHIFDASCDEECDDCGFRREGKHDFSISKSNGTSTWLECSGCGEKSEETEKKSGYGCLGSITGTLISMVSLCATALYLKKKREL